MDIKIIRSIDEVSPEVWDAIVGEDGIIRSHTFLRAVERSGLNDCRYWYVMAYDGERLVAHCSAFAISFYLDIFGAGAAGRAAASLRKIIPSFLRVQVVESGSPVALGHMFSIAPSVPKAVVMPLLIKAIEGIARKERIALMVMRDFVGPEVATFCDIPQAGYGGVWNLPDCVVENRWASFEAYLDDMRSDYRYKLRKRMAHMKTCGIRVEVQTTFAHHAPRLRALWMQTYERAKEYQREILTDAYFELMDQCMGDRSRTILLWKGEELVGFSLVLLDDQTLRFLYTGLDYRYSKSDLLYFNLLYEVVRLGIETGKKHIEMGITTYPPKFDLGARLQPLQMYMKHSSRALSPTVVALFKSTTPEHKTSGRNVFRSATEAGEPAHAAVRSGAPDR